jgi:uncharacterized protein (TIGR02300 family)
LLLRANCPNLDFSEIAFDSRARSWQRPPPNDDHARCGHALARLKLSLWRILILATAKLGTKRVCPSCGGKFYDLGNTPAECPYCEAAFNPEDLIRGRGKKAAPEPAPVAAEEEKKPEAEKAAETEDEILEEAVPEDADDTDDDDDDDDDDVLEDASDLGEDDDDVAEVVEKIDRPGEER